jgi:hypothetical protein
MYKKRQPENHKKQLPTVRSTHKKGVTIMQVYIQPKFVATTRVFVIGICIYILRIYSWAVYLDGTVHTTIKASDHRTVKRKESRNKCERKTR